MQQADIEIRLAGIGPLAKGFHSDNSEMCRAAKKLAALTIEGPGECKLWTGYTQPNGYGYVNVGKLKMPAHRLALVLSGVAIPKGMDACHICDVRNCVNPDHLYVGTRQQNMADCIARKRHNKPFGEDHPRAKLSSEQVALIRKRRLLGEKVKSIATSFNVHHGTVSRIARGVWRQEVT